jgi:hypothetical protein
MTGNISVSQRYTGLELFLQILIDTLFQSSASFLWLLKVPADISCPASDLHSCIFVLMNLVTSIFSYQTREKLKPCCLGATCKGRSQNGGNIIYTFHLSFCSTGLRFYSMCLMLMICYEGWSLEWCCRKEWSLKSKHYLFVHFHSWQSLIYHPKFMVKLKYSLLYTCVLNPKTSNWACVHFIMYHLLSFCNVSYSSVTERFHWYFRVAGGKYRIFWSIFVLQLKIL